MPGVGFSFQLIGAEKLAKSLSKETIQKPVNEGIRRITIWLNSQVAQSTPVVTGRLRSSITQEISGDVGKVGTNVQYAPFVEYGTSRMQPRYVTPGSSVRVKGKGPFRYSMENLNRKIVDFIKDIGEAISVRFG